MYVFDITYSTKFWQDKTLANQLFQSFGEKNVGNFIYLTFSYLSEPGIWLSKILCE